MMIFLLLDIYINSLSLIVTEFAYLVVGSKKESIVADRLFFVIYGAMPQWYWAGLENQ